VYHLELRQFPHNLCRFNLTEQELRAVVEPWAREQWVQLGERRWSPHQARLTVLEGPRIPVGQLTMGRGWRSAQRHCEEVTDRVLTAAKIVDVGTSASAAEDISAAGASSAAGVSSAAKNASAELALQADSLGLELLSQLEEAPAPLSRAWQLARSRFPERAASECLALAEQAIRSLLQRRLIALVANSVHASDHGVPGEAHRGLVGAELEQVLRVPDSWVGEGGHAAVRVRRT
jgi:hypothetical protein